MATSEQSTHKTQPGSLMQNVSLARHTTWRVGGPAKQLFVPSSINDLSHFFQQHPEEPVLFLGLGSNTLIRDGGIPATVILTHRGLMHMTQVDTHTVHVQAGVPCAKVARFCAHMGLTGAEYLAGIPGTMGGALAMNAGCHGGETWNNVISVETINRQGQIQTRPKSDFKIAYRHVEGPVDEWFVATTLKFESDNNKQAIQKINELLAVRAATQPTSEHNAGSVFRNPPNNFAARLIEQAGLKGLQIGGACVSTKHANFIINTGNATAADIEQLIETVSKKVFEHFGVQLIREVRIIGEK